MSLFPGSNHSLRRRWGHRGCTGWGRDYHYFQKIIWRPKTIHMQIIAETLNSILKVWPVNTVLDLNHQKIHFSLLQSSRATLKNNGGMLYILQQKPLWSSVHKRNPKHIHAFHLNPFLLREQKGICKVFRTSSHHISGLSRYSYLTSDISDRWNLKAIFFGSFTA